MSKQFDAAHFWDFCKSLRIDTKEKGVIRLGDQVLGTQRRFIGEVESGLNEGVHEFVVLKCRQIGLSTIGLALDLYWTGKYSGLTGSLVVHDDPARDSFRSTLEMYHSGLPDRWRRGIRTHNRNQLVFDHGTRLLYRVAGSRKTGGGALGRSSAISFLHATEISSWGDEQGLQSLKGSMAETNPNRLYLWESTARGFNMFYDMWMDAKRSVTTRAIFISWWANEIYRAPRGGVRFEAYWGRTGRPTGEERARARAVKLLYGVDIDDEMFAWYRWCAAEKVTDELNVMEEFPWTEEEAFVATGSQFFRGQDISAAYKRIMSAKKPEAFRLVFGMNFWDTQLSPAPEKSATLKVWERAVDDGVYAMGVDPAYGSSENADRHCVSVWRCYSDRIEQVCEWATSDGTTANVAWGMVYLAGVYWPCTVNLEITGPGTAVKNEIDNLRRQSTLQSGAPGGRELYNILSHMRTYLYKRVDSIYGAPSALHTMTTMATKERYMNQMRDYFERDMLVVRSKDLVDEMKGFVRDDSGGLDSSGRAKNDRVIGAALACLAWNDQIRTGLISRNVSYARAHQTGKSGPMDAVEASVQRLLINAGVIRVEKDIPGVKGGVPTRRA